MWRLRWRLCHGFSRWSVVTELDGFVSSQRALPHSRMMADRALRALSGWAHGFNAVLLDLRQLRSRRVGLGTAYHGARSMRPGRRRRVLGPQIGVFGLSERKALHSHRNHKNQNYFHGIYLTAKH
jgi:hypothetical protein